MVTSTPTSDAAPGLASITAIAALANPRRVLLSKTVILDAQIYVGSSSCESLLGALRFFNASDLKFSAEPGLYLIYATFARMEADADVQSTVIAPSDYAFVGDLQWVISLNPPPQGSTNEDFTDKDSPDNASEYHETSGSPFLIDPRHRPYVHLSGVAMNCQQKAATFTLDIEHYVSALKDHKGFQGKSIKPTAPILCVIPDLPKYKNGKPVPYNKRFVSVSGFLSDVAFKEGTTDVVDRFTVTVDHVVFMGQYSNSSGHNAIPNTLDSTPPMARGSKGLINYGRRGNTSSDSTLTSPATPVTPTPQGRKRPRVEFESSIESIPATEKNTN